MRRSCSRARMFAETRWGLAMSMYTKMLGISLPLYSASVCPSPSPPATSRRLLEIQARPQPRGNPMLAYYDTRDRTIFRIYLRKPFETDAVYRARRQKRTLPARSRSPTARRRWISPATSSTEPPKAKCRPICRFQPRRTLAIPSLTRINGARWKIASSIFLDSGRPLTISARDHFVLPPNQRAALANALAEKIC